MSVESRLTRPEARLMRRKAALIRPGSALANAEPGCARPEARHATVRSRSYARLRRFRNATAPRDSAARAEGSGVGLTEVTLTLSSR